MTPMLHPVTSTPWPYPKEDVVAVFFNSRDADDFAMHPERFGASGTFYGGMPDYDLRTQGYRAQRIPYEPCTWVISDDERQGRWAA